MNRIQSIKIKNIAISVKDKSLLKIKEMIIQKNELLYVYGPNGSGKSTFLKFLNCQLTKNYMIQPLEAGKEPYANINFEDGQTLDLTQQSTAKPSALSSLEATRLYFDGDVGGRYTMSTLFKRNWAILKDDIINKIKGPERYQLNPNFQQSEIDEPIQRLFTGEKGNENLQTFFSSYLDQDQGNDSEDNKGLKLYQQLTVFLKICYLLRKEFNSKVRQKLSPTIFLSRLKSLVLFVKNKYYIAQSAGQKQIIYLYKSIIAYNHPKLKLSLLSLDEPLNYLDSQNRFAIIQEIQKLAHDSQRNDSIIILVSHCTSFAFLDKPYLPMYGQRKIRRIYIDTSQGNHAIEKKPGSEKEPGEPMRGCMRCDRNKV
jgi:ABC-type cobalamin/Fe3+-siderophores transport system ATPase subunit